LREVILPAGNLRDLRDVPPEVRDRMQIHLVERVDRVFELALLSKSKEGTASPRHAGGRAGDAERQAAGER
ncbi:MAG: hypothetical protein M3409_03155, partial [Gemmatimonadota bacterium]|nr:hypothetical protein [Gemmatimonadota bacterium]